MHPEIGQEPGAVVRVHCRYHRWNVRQLLDALIRREEVAHVASFLIWDREFAPSHSMFDLDSDFVVDKSLFLADTRILWSETLLYLNVWKI